MQYKAGIFVSRGRFRDWNDEIWKKFGCKPQYIYLFFKKMPLTHQKEEKFLFSFSYILYAAFGRKSFWGSNKNLLNMWNCSFYIS